MPGHNNARAGPASRVAAALVVLATAVPGVLDAQLGLFPRAVPFEYPLAHARPNGIYGRLLSVTRGESRFGAEREAEAGIGETFPVLALGRGVFPVTLGLGVGVAARFSLDDPRSAMLSSDWVVGVHATGDAGPWRVNLHLYHESSHLGDEYAERFGAPRVDWTREVASLWTSRQLGNFTAHGNAALAVVDGLELERGTVGLGFDYRHARTGGDNIGVSPIVGVYVESAAYARWKLTSSARLGVEMNASGRAVAVSVVALDGLSSQRQFFRERSRYVGFELRFDL